MRCAKRKLKKVFFLKAPAVRNHFLISVIFNCIARKTKDNIPCRTCWYEIDSRSIKIVYNVTLRSNLLQTALSCRWQNSRSLTSFGSLAIAAERNSQSEITLNCTNSYHFIFVYSKLHSAWDAHRCRPPKWNEWWVQFFASEKYTSYLEVRRTIHAAWTLTSRCMALHGTKMKYKWTA